MKGYRIVYLGTPEFSVPALQALYENQYDVVAVVTQPDRPKGRGRRLIPPPVKKSALALGYPVLQPPAIKETPFIETIISLDPDLFVVVAYGRILPGSFLSIPRLGAINIHPSLLPRYRGPAPVQWAIINGEKETGVTTIWMDEGMDTGDILLRKRVAIEHDETSGSLHDRLAQVGAGLLIETLDRLRSGDLAGVAQDRSEATYAPLLRKEDGRIDWSRDAKSLEALIRGLNPWPGAFTFLSGKRLKVIKAKHLETRKKESPGTVLEGFPGEFLVATGSGTLALTEVHLESGRCLSAEAFLRGCSVPPGTVLG